MANTLKFGNGEWYGKKDTILAYNDENSNYKPLPFNFSRASKATVINKDGLIEEVGIGQPRIDYLNNTKGAMLLEPSRTNLITYSSDFPNTYWTKNGASIQADPSTQGSEEITNGSFDTDSDWTKGTGWTISGGKAVSNSSVGFQSLSQSNAISNSNGKTFKCNFTISGYSSGLVALYISGFLNNSYFIGANGDYEIYIMVSQGTSGNVEFLTNSSGFVGSIDNVSIKEVQGFSAPDGTNNSYKLVEGNSNSIHRMYQTATVSASPNASISIFVKYNGRKFVLMRIADSTVGRWYDIENGVLGSAFQGTPNDSSIESVGNGWYRISISNTVSSVARLELWVSDTESTSAYQGDTTKGVYIYGAQLEAGSYSTSYISTSGSSVTRLADVCNNGGNEQVINSTEGVLYAEIKALSEIGGNRYISLSDGTDSNRIILRFQDTDKVGCYVRSASGTDADITKTSASISSNFLKVAVKWKTNDVALWVNGVEVGVDSSFTTFNANVLNRLNLTGATTTTSQYFYGNVKDVKVYNTALSDSELASLTS